MSSPEECEAFKTILIPESLEILWLHNKEAPLLRHSCFCLEKTARYLHDIIMLQDVFDVLTDRYLLAALENLLRSHQTREVWKIVNRYEINLLAIFGSSLLLISFVLMLHLHNAVFIINICGVGVFFISGCIGSGG